MVRSLFLPTCISNVQTLGFETIQRLDLGPLPSVAVRGNFGAGSPVAVAVAVAVELADTADYSRLGWGLDNLQRLPLPPLLPSQSRLRRKSIDDVLIPQWVDQKAISSQSHPSLPPSHFPRPYPLRLAALPDH